jgi:hypothetical protein
MDHSIAHYLSDHFPDLDHPKYQSVLEKIGFLLVTTMIVGALAGVLVLFCLLL